MKLSTSFLRHTLIAAILTCAASAQAITLVQPNAGGGKLMLTGTTCPKPGFAVLKQAYSFVTNGSAIFGCWTLMDGMIHISWDNGVRSIFEVDSFTVQDEPARVSPVRPSRAL